MNSISVPLNFRVSESLRFWILCLWNFKSSEGLDPWFFELSSFRVFTSAHLCILISLYLWIFVFLWCPMSLDVEFLVCLFLQIKENSGFGASDVSENNDKFATRLLPEIRVNRIIIIKGQKLLYFISWQIRSGRNVVKFSCRSKIIWGFMSARLSADLVTIYFLKGNRFKGAPGELEGYSKTGVTTKFPWGRYFIILRE